MPKIEGSVESIVFRNEENHYTVARFRPNDSGRLLRDELTTIVGALPGVQVGELLSIEGEWETDPRYGRQLHVNSFVQRLPASPEGIVRYLSSGLIKGIGPKKAQLIVDHFGEQTLAILEQQPERLSEVKARYLFLQSHDFSINVATRVYKQYGKESIRVIRENPYQLAQDVHGIGFRTADDIAVKLGLPYNSVPRLASGLKYVLTQAANEDGHCFLPADDLVSRASDILKVSSEALPAAMEQLRNERDVFIEPPLNRQLALFTDAAAPAGDEGGVEEIAATPHIYFGPFYYAESGSAPLLRLLMQAPSCLPPATQQLWDAVFSLLRQKRNMHLTEKQRAAVQMAYREKVSILTGGPGTGKSTSLRALLMLLRKRRVRVALAAPTGRAAKRLTEATGATDMPAKTLHRLLEFVPRDNS